MKGTDFKGGICENMQEKKYSVVIPVYNSEKIVEKTVSRTVDFFVSKGLAHEVILVNDGSQDKSWEVISDLAEKNSCIMAINLLKNYGQHNANLCGFKHAGGDYVITMDDDLQNPPEEIEKLIDTAADGCDLVIGKFKEKKHAGYRRVGSRLIGWINRSIFDVPNNIRLTNFRLIKRSVIDRVLAYKTSYPYIPGLVVQFSHDVKNVLVEHQNREVGKSNYSIAKILALVSTILFNYSSLPLKIVARFGILTASVLMLLGGYYFLSSLIAGVEVPGWTTIVLMLSFFNAISLIMLSMLGEYLVRLINQTSDLEAYHVKDVIRVNDE